MAFLSTSYSNSQEVAYQTTAGTTSTTLDPGVVYSTGNIVQPTISGTGTTPWVNGVYQDQLTCWGWGNPGNCGPNPSVRPGGYINYSYGYTDLYQVQSIAGVLPTSGLRVNGYNFGFTAKNGNGWDDGRVDTLSAYVNFYGSDGKSVRNDYYNLNYQFNWTAFNYSKTFDTPYAAKDLSTVRYGFVGQDNNFWAGTYGPEIMDVSFSLKYSVDPCATNPLYSPTCPGYLDALAKLTPGVTTVVADTSTAITGTEPPPPPPPDGSPPPPPGSPPPPPGSPPPPDGAPPPPGTQTTTIAGAPPPPPPPSSSGGNSQPAKVGETQPSGGGSKSTVSTSQALSMISSQQAKNADVANSVTAAAQAVATTAAAQATSQAESIAGAAAAASATAGQGSGIGFSSSQSSGSSVAMSNSSGTGIGINSARLGQTDTYSAVSDTSVAAVSYSLQQAGRQTSFEAEMPRTEGLRMNSGSPLDNLLNPGLEAPSATVEQQFSTVKKNVQNNEAAGGVDIAVMAVQPQGYQAYSVAMPDTAFYAPREIYRNQVNVDNVRLLRGLGNDRLHQDLVNLQYK